MAPSLKVVSERVDNLGSAAERFACREGWDRAIQEVANAREKVAELLVRPYPYDRQCQFM